MPLTEMMLFITTSAQVNDENCYASIIQIVLRPLLEHQPTGGYKDDVIDDERLMKWYFPYAATKSDVESNAKVAFLIEALTRLWHFNGENKDQDKEKSKDKEKNKMKDQDKDLDVGLRYSERMKEAIERGITARAAKISKKKTTTKKEVNMKESRQILDMSEMRLRLLLEDAKQKQILRRNKRRVPL